jgi:hypothetical protein
MSTIESTGFMVSEEKPAELLASRPGMLADFAADRTGFVNARLVRLPAASGCTSSSGLRRKGSPRAMPRAATCRA